jgi:hypothetical protein
MMSGAQTGTFDYTPTIRAAAQSISNIAGMASTYSRGESSRLIESAASKRAMADQLDGQIAVLTQQRNDLRAAADAERIAAALATRNSEMYRFHAGKAFMGLVGSLRADQKTLEQPQRIPLESMNQLGYQTHHNSIELRTLANEQGFTFNSVELLGLFPPPQYDHNLTLADAQKFLNEWITRLPTHYDDASAAATTAKYEL